MMARWRWAALGGLVLSLALGGCATNGGGLGDLFGGGDEEPRGATAGILDGTVERVDTRERVILVRAEAVRGDQRGRTELVPVQYDERTRVEHRGQQHRPEDLEPGDRIEARVDARGDRLLAQDIRVTEDVRGRGGVATRDRDGMDGRRGFQSVDGVVRDVDPEAQVIELERLGGRFDDRSGGRGGERMTVRYDRSTRVEYQGRSLDPASLRRGDEVRIEVRDQGGDLVAQDIAVVREARDAWG
jgi:hypothetical protein